MIRRKVIIPLVLTTVLGGAVYGTNKVQAFNSNPFSDLAQIISQKLDVDQTKVQAVIAEYQEEKHNSRQMEMKKSESDRLGQLVSQKKINESQKQEIIAKLEELRVKYQPNGLRGKTTEEKLQTIENRKAELSAWLRSRKINIDIDVLGIGSRMGRGNGYGR